MVGNNKIFLSLFIFCLFSLTLLQVSLKVGQSGQFTQVLGVTTSNSLTCPGLYQFYQQNCVSNTPLYSPPTPPPECTNGETRCLNSLTYQTCSLGRWQAFNCPDNQPCTDNDHCLQ